MRRTLLITALVTVLLVGLGVFIAVRQFGPELPIPIGKACAVRTDAGVVKLNPDQMANAATIAAVGLSSELPDRAIVVALATALQESELVNLGGGDRDSVGLFQQRPSQGWGTVDQIIDPRYSSKAFYNQLVRTPGWEDMRITEAAQSVQRSAYPEAYDQWVDDASIIGEALVGTTGSAVSCTRVGEPPVRGMEAAFALRADLVGDWNDDIGTVSSAELIGLTVPAGDARAGWQYAHWLVAHSTDRGVQRVQFGDQAWSADTGTWTAVDSGTDHVLAEVYQP